MNLEGIDSNITDISFVTEGGDLSKVFNYFSFLIVDYVREYLLGTNLQETTIKALEGFLNNELIQIP